MSVICQQASADSALPLWTPRWQAQSIAVLSAAIPRCGPKPTHEFASFEFDTLPFSLSLTSLEFPPPQLKNLNQCNREQNHPSLMIWSRRRCPQPVKRSPRRLPPLKRSHQFHLHPQCFNHLPLMILVMGIPMILIHSFDIYLLSIMDFTSVPIAFPLSLSLSLSLSLYVHSCSASTSQSCYVQFIVFRLIHSITQ